MTDKYETSIFTRQQMKSARVKGQMKGWMQGAGSTLVFVILWKLLGWLWIPALILVGVLAFFGYRKFKTGDEDAV